MINYVARDRSVITGKQNLESLYTFKNFPVFFGCVEHNQSEDLQADMSWAIDPDTGVIQLDKLIPLEILYQAQHVDGTGPTWNQYYHDLADYIQEQGMTNILEIGGGKGVLAEIFINQTKGTTWSIVEPNPLHEGSERIKVISAFFDKNFRYDEPVEAVVFSQVMEHAYDPQEFVQSIAGYLKPGGKLVFAYPNLKLWLERKYTNAINFEHTMFLTDYFVDYLLQKYGFTIADKREYKDHSFFYTAVRSEDSSSLPAVENKYNEYKQIFNDFLEYHQKLVKDLNQQMDGFEGEIYMFGAHIFAQYLLEFGLNKDKIASLLDNSPLKQGKRLYGSSLTVQKPEVVRGKGKVGVVLKVGIYRDEIAKQLKELNPEVVFFE